MCLWRRWHWISISRRSWCSTPAFRSWLLQHFQCNDVFGPLFTRQVNFTELSPSKGPSHLTTIACINRRDWKAWEEGSTFSLSSLLSESNEILLVSDMSWSWRNFFDFDSRRFSGKEIVRVCLCPRKKRRRQVGEGPQRDSPSLPLSNRQICTDTFPVGHTLVLLVVLPVRWDRSSHVPY